MSSVHADAGHLQGCPHGIAGEELIIGRNARELHNSELQNELIDQLLRFLLGECPIGQIAADIDVEEGGNSADAHRGAVLCLDGSKVAKVQPLHSLLRIHSRLGDIEAIGGRHLLHALQGLDLLGDLLALADHIVCHHAAAAVLQIILLCAQKKIDTV